MYDDKIIYHYCSAETFLKIISSKSLFLTSTRTMNDSLELEWFKRLFINRLNEKFNEGVDRQILDNIYTNVMINVTPKYISCFSEERDLLSQWRAYADDGKGISIGFLIKDINVNQKIPFTMAADNDKNSIGLCKIIYQDEVQRDIIDKLINEILLGKNDIKSYLNIAQFSTIFKNSAFSEEKEWRLIHSPLIACDGNSTGCLIMGKISECKFRMTNFGISPYFVWNFESHNPLPVKEIILGPQHRSNFDEIDLFMKYNGFRNVVISRSSASYRS